MASAPWTTFTVPPLPPTAHPVTGLEPVSVTVYGVYEKINPHVRDEANVSDRSNYGRVDPDEFAFPVQPAVRAKVAAVAEGRRTREPTVQRRTCRAMFAGLDALPVLPIHVSAEEPEKEDDERRKVQGRP